MRPSISLMSGKGIYTTRLSCFIKARTLRDNYKREQFAKYETRRQALKYIAHNTTLSPLQRAEAQLALTMLPVSSQPTKIKNRCVIGGKGRGVLSEFKMARFPFRMHAIAGDIPGVRKASW